MSLDISQLDLVVRNALESFTEDFVRSDWWGKEHDCVNRFAHGFLLPLFSPESGLRHPTQLGIEVGVAQPPGFTRPAARKDLVIWPEPWMSCWDTTFKPVNCPVAVMEWKIVQTGRALRCHRHDREWLSAFARTQPHAVGYSVAFNRRRGQREQLLVVRFCGEEVTDPWLRI